MRLINRWSRPTSQSSNLCAQICRLPGRLLNSVVRPALVKRAQTPKAEKARQELKEVHAYERDAHFANDVDALMLNQADDFIAIS